MYLVHQKKRFEGKWEVAWMWLPHFLAADQALHKYVDQQMTATFKGTVVDDQDGARLVEEMHQRVLDLLLEKYPIPGMRRFLEGYVHLRPEEENPAKGQANGS